MHLRSILSSKKKKNETNFSETCMYFKIYRSNFPNFPRLSSNWHSLLFVLWNWKFASLSDKFENCLQIIYARQIEGGKKKTNWIIVTRKLQKKSVLYICMVCFNNVLIIAQRINKTKNEIKKNNMYRLIFSRIKNLKL